MITIEIITDDFQNSEKEYETFSELDNALYRFNELKEHYETSKCFIIKEDDPGYCVFKNQTANETVTIKLYYANF